jgi:hypothetical protein
VGGLLRCRCVRLAIQHEDFGNTAAEAIACGTTVDHYGPLGHSSAGERPRWIVIPHTATDLAAAIGRHDLSDTANHTRFGLPEGWKLVFADSLGFPDSAVLILARFLTRIDSCLRGEVCPSCGRLRNR